MTETRTAIVRATLGLIRAGGLNAATVPAIARAADVAPATVRNHFPDQAALLAAVGDTVLDDLALPDATMFDGLRSPTERVSRLAHELVAFFGRGEEWWYVLTGDPTLAPAFEHASAAYEAWFDGLVRGSLGPLADDEATVAMVSSVVGPPLHYALIGRGLTPDRVVEASLAMLLPWLEAQAVADGASRARPGRARPRTTAR
jgi:AcrR family transcriptional regulator